MDSGNRGNRECREGTIKAVRRFLRGVAFGYRFTAAMHLLNTKPHDEDTLPEITGLLDSLINQIQPGFQGLDEETLRVAVTHALPQLKATTTYMFHDMMKWYEFAMGEAMSHSHDMPDDMLEAYVGMMTEQHADLSYNVVTLKRELSGTMIDEALDFGCGSGAMAKGLDAAMYEENVVLLNWRAYDRQEIRAIAGLEKDQSYELPGGRRYQGISELALGSRDDFDFVLLSEVLHGKQNIYAFLTGVVLPLVKEGRFIFVMEMFGDQREPFFDLQMHVHCASGGWEERLTQAMLSIAKDGHKVTLCGAVTEFHRGILIQKDARN